MNASAHCVAWGDARNRGCTERLTAEALPPRPRAIDSGKGLAEHSARPLGSSLAQRVGSEKSKVSRPPCRLLPKLDGRLSRPLQRSLPGALHDANGS